MRNVDFSGLPSQIVTAFGWGIGIAAAKWVCTLISIRGFNLNF